MNKSPASQSSIVNYTTEQQRYDPVRRNSELHAALTGRFDRALPGFIQIGEMRFLETDAELERAGLWCRERIPDPHHEAVLALGFFDACDFE